MKNLDHNRLETHVKVLGWLNIVGGVLLLVLGDDGDGLFGQWGDGAGNGRSPVPRYR